MGERRLHARQYDKGRTCEYEDSTWRQEAHVTEFKVLGRQLKPRWQEQSFVIGIFIRKVLSV